ncbi:MAG: GFA family protein, partial [Proteobacteria bacterium]|nr:GFA family protein [Pseudomonadota bacterium]
MLLEGSCQCGAVRFSLESHTPYPYARCYCSICRKTAGSGGFGIFLLGLAETLKIEGEENITRYQAKMDDGNVSPAERGFCNRCGSQLRLVAPRWPQHL